VVLRSLRWFAYAAVALYFVLGLAWLGLRYLVLPHADQWRGTIAQQLSQALGTPVSLGAIDIQWRGVNPQLVLHDVITGKPQGDGQLRLPYLHAIVHWRSLIERQLQFAHLEVAGLDVTVRRDAQGVLWVLEQKVSQPVASEDASVQLPLALRWLLAQPRIDFSDVTLRWRDDLRQAPPLVLQHANLQVHHHGAEYAVSLAVSPPSALAGALDLRAEFQMHALLAQGQALDWSALQGKVYVRVDAMQPKAWQPWLDVPAPWVAGSIWTQASVQFNAGRAGQAALDVRVEKGQWEWQTKNRLGVAQARLHVEGPWQALAAWHPDAAPTAHALRFQLRVTDARGQFPALFDQTLQWDALAVAGQLGTQTDGKPQVTFEQVAATNADMELAFQGSWHAQSGTEAGVADIQGSIDRLNLTAMARYLPILVSADARQWLRTGLLAGQLRQARWGVRGDLAHFPFGDAPEKGDYTLQGRVHNAVIDYAPQVKGELPWPRLENVQGTLNMRRVTLALQAERATMLPAPGLTPIRLRGLQGTIPNIERNAELTVQGTGLAPAATFLGLMQHSPLGQRLDDVFVEATGAGQWEVPLTLVVPLLHSIDLRVVGEVQFRDGSLQLMPEMPPFARLQGAVAFTEDAITARRLQGQFLGGSLTVRGGIGAQQSGLELTGYVTAPALQDYVGLQGMRHVQGRADYSATLQRQQRRGFELTLASDLNGMALTFPAPFAKPDDVSLPLRASWRTLVNTAERQQVLRVELGNTTLLRLLHRPDVADSTYFQAGSLIMNRPAPARLDAGMRVDLRSTQVDMAAWYRVVQAFGAPIVTDDAKTVSRRPLLPDLRDLRVQANRIHLYGLDMPQASLHAALAGADTWRVTLDSPQTAGTLTWHQADEPHSTVQAQFDRLHINGSPGTTDADTRAPPQVAETAAQISDTLTLPAIDLHVRQFTLHDTLLGELSLTGRPQESQWILQSLRLSGDGLALQGNGHWHTQGAQRGLSLQASAEVSDLGAYLTQTGFQNLAAGGRGTLESTLFWRDLPWQTDVAHLQGTIQIGLEKGRFSRVHSRLARLLEVLSIQSVTRLASLDWNLDALVREGFPFDMLRGEIRVRDGKLETQDYRVVGPVGTIVIGGEVDLLAQRQDLQALVIPNLDVSGAALAAGIAANPIVGVGAFLAQWLLRVPLEKAMAVEYQVRGSWDEPDIQTTKVKTPQPPPDVTSFPPD